MNALKVIIVDDEAPARRRLARLLESHSDIAILGTAGNADEAAPLLASRPDIAFLDIQMPGLDGLALAERHGRDLRVVFVTAHAEHAVRAFELDSVDYLLKPVRAERLDEALRRARRSAGPALENSQTESPRITAHERGTTVLVDARDVSRIHALDKYSAFVVDGREHLTEESLLSLERRLAPFGFVRVHRAELVRLDAVRAYRILEGRHAIDLVDGQTVIVSRRLASTVRARLRV